jgi:hypothetical protein
MGPCGFGTRGLCDHGALGPWDFGIRCALGPRGFWTMGLGGYEYLDPGDFDPWYFGTMAQWDFVAMGFCFLGTLAFWDLVFWPLWDFGPMGL